MKVYDFEKFKQAKLQQKIIKVGDRILWFDPVFQKHHNNQVINIWNSEHEIVLQADLNVAPTGYSLELENGMVIVSDLFKKKGRRDVENLKKAPKPA